MSRHRKPSPPAWSATCHRVSEPHRNSPRFCVSEHEAELGLLPRLAPTSDNANHVVGNEPHPVPKDQRFGLEPAPGVFSCVRSHMLRRSVRYDGDIVAKLARLEMYRGCRNLSVVQGFVFSARLAGINHSN